MKRGDTLDLTIDSLAFGGAGVGRALEGDRSFVVFVEDTVPGDRVRVRIGGRKRNFANGYVEEFLEGSGRRVKPLCKHFGLDGDRCGGCTLQFLGYDDQLAIKEQQVRDALQRIGRFDPSVVLPIIGAAATAGSSTAAAGSSTAGPWFYRNKMEFSFGRDADGRLGLGLHVRRRHHDVVEMTECHLFAPWAGDFVVAVRDFFREMDAHGVFGENGGVGDGGGEESSDGLARLFSLMVREGKNTGEIMVNLIAENAGLLAEAPEFLEGFLKLVLDFFGSNVTFSAVRGAGAKGAPTSVYFTNVTNIKGAPNRREERLLWGAPVIRESLRIGKNNELYFEIAPQAFFQP
ncbi:TRAM domain-containing protein, partial [Patescibacteria group bacterium]|nr:TRAM domain-containing protein [Patescibacteria group bacterium]